MSFLSKWRAAAAVLGCLLALSAGCGSGASAGKKTREGDSAAAVRSKAGPPFLGVNFNEHCDHINFRDMARTHTRWARAFIEFFRLYPDTAALLQDARVNGYCSLKDSGYHTILNIKWNFHRRNFPRPGSKEMGRYEAYLTKLLDRVWPKTDILVVGNEPFIETRPSESGAPLVSFYEEISRFIRRYEQSGSRRQIPLFMGAFNNLYLKDWRTPAVGELLSFARETPWIAGVDIHIHHGEMDQVNSSVDYVNGRIRDNQRILVTEFSFVKYFQTKMDSLIPASFARRYGFSGSTKNYAFINYAIHHPVPRSEWVDFLKNSKWFEDHKGYLRGCYRVFSAFPKVMGATYCLRQQWRAGKDFTMHQKPWILNGIMAPVTVRPDPRSGQTSFNYAWYRDFFAIQEGKSGQRTAFRRRPAG
jgi:hypothetical protein